MIMSYEMNVQLISVLIATTSVLIAVWGVRLSTESLKEQLAHERELQQKTVEIDYLRKLLELGDEPYRECLNLVGFVSDNRLQTLVNLCLGKAETAEQVVEHRR